MNSRITKWARNWPLLSLLYFYCQVGFSQSPFFLHYSVPEGLPSSEVYEVHQDKKGFIWFATDNGVVKYDGNQFETFQVNKGLSDPVVFGIEEDSKDRIWFRTFSGRICYYNNKKIHTYQFNDTLHSLCKNTFLFTLYPDSLDNIWFSNAYEIGKIDPNGNIQKEAIEPYQLYLKKIDDRFIIGPSGPRDSISSVKVDKKVFPLLVKDTVHTHPIICTVKWKGEEYFSMGATVYKIGKEAVERAFTGKDQIISLSKDMDDNLWVGYLKNGADRYTSFNNAKPVRLSFLNSKSVTRVLQDTQRGYWISTLEDGVYYIPESTFPTHTISDRTKITTVFSREDKTFIGDDSGLVSILDPSGEVVTQKKFAKHSILSILSDSKENIWISTNIETFILDDRLNTKKKIETSMSCMTEDTQEFVWGIGGWQVYKFNSDGERIYKFLHGTSRSLSLIGDKIYLFGRLGLSVFFPNSIEASKMPQSFERLKISKVISLSSSFILVATQGSGFYVVNTNDWSYKHYDSKNNFIADNIYAAITVDSTLWLGTEKGVAATKVKYLLLNSPSFQFYTKRNGLSSNRIGHLSYSKSNVWAFYDEGFSLLPADLPNKKQHNPVFYLKEVLINNRVDSLETLNRLTYDKNNVQIDFGFIDLTNQNILIRYRLSSSSDWNYTTERRVEFFSLSSGEYFFELEYSTDNFHWISALKHPVNISPQWLMNWKIQLTLTLALGLFGFLYYRRRIRLLGEKQELLGIINEQQQKLLRAELETLESERSRIAKDLHDSVGTNLAAIKLFLSSFLKKSNEPNASIIEETLQETIQGTRDIITNLSPAHLELFGLVEAIKVYVQRIKDQFDINIELNALGNEVNQPEISIHLFRILQELITNSLKYASANKITIIINYTSNRIIIRYEDDGVGFQAKSISKGNGLLNIQSRIQILEGAIKFESGNKGVSYLIEVPLKTHQS